MPYQKRYIPLKHRQRLWKCPCAACGKPPDRDTQIDHIVPLAAGGRHEPGNWQALCARCNSFKGPRPMSNREVLAGQIKQAAGKYAYDPPALRQQGGLHGG